MVEQHSGGRTVSGSRTALRLQNSTKEAEQHSGGKTTPKRHEAAPQEAPYQEADCKYNIARSTTECQVYTKPHKAIWGSLRGVKHTSNTSNQPAFWCKHRLNSESKCFLCLKLEAGYRFMLQGCNKLVVIYERRILLVVI